MNIHKSRQAINFFNNNGWVMIVSEGGQSRLNPIEKCFSLVKRHYYKNKINIAANPNFGEDNKPQNQLYME